MPECDVIRYLASMRDSSETRDLGRLVIALKEMVLDYSPSADLLKRIVSQRRPMTLGMPDQQGSLAEMNL